MPQQGFAPLGALVCQDGARTYYSPATAKRVPCGIKVNQTSAQWSLGGSFTDVFGESATASYTSVEGDSGALVFYLCGTTCRVAYGQVSGTASAGTEMFFPAADDILGSSNAFNFNTYGLVLQPRT